MFSLIETPVQRNPLNCTIGDMPWFAFGDIHGRLDLLEFVLETITQKANGKPFGLLSLGDLIDRGPRGWACLNLMEKAQELTGATQFIQLPGNHELMMIDMAMGRMRDADLWTSNGGRAMLEEIKHETGTLSTWGAIRQAVLERMSDFWKQDNLTGHARIGDFLFVHAGISPYQPLEAFLAQPSKQAHEAAQYGEHWAWIRRPFLQHGGPWHKNDTLTVVHGHTPAFGRPIPDAEALLTTLYYPQGARRICLDVGAASMPQACIGHFEHNTVKLIGVVQDTGWLP